MTRDKWSYYKPDDEFVQNLIEPTELIERLHAPSCSPHNWLKSMVPKCKTIEYSNMKLSFICFIFNVSVLTQIESFNKHVNTVNLE